MSEFDLFISYSSRNEKKARNIFDLSKKKGLRPYLSKEFLKLGIPWKDEIRRALLNSEVLCILVTPASMKSEWVLTEWGAAWVLEKPIIPILSGCKINELPDRLKDLQCTYYNKLDETLNYLAEILGKGVSFKIRRITDPKDPQFLRSAKLYKEIDRDFREEFDQIWEWLVENMPEKEKEALEELYYVAYFRGEVVGILYATIYKRPYHQCFISYIVVREKNRKCNEEITALTLIDQLAEDVDELDPLCNQFFYEISREDDKYSEHELNRCIRILQDLKPKWHALRFKGLDYIQPDLSKSFDKNKEKQCHLLCLSEQVQARIFRKKDFIKEILEFVYMRIYMESFTGDMEVGKHTSYIHDVYKRVKKTVEEEVGLEPLF